jgi:YaiO family outer membrane protein
VRRRGVLVALPLVLAALGLAGGKARAEKPSAVAVVPLPEAPEANVLTKAAALDKYGDRRGALRLLARQLGKTPGDVAARALSAKLLLADRRYDEARAENALLLRASPGDPRAVRDAIHIELLSGDPERAIALANDALQRDPKAADLYVERARAFAIQGRPEEALADLDHAVQIDPHDRGALLLRRRARAAAAIWGAPAALSPPARPDAWHVAPALLTSIPRAFLSLAMLQALAEEEPPTQAAPELLAEVRALDKEGDRKGALRILSWHLEASPDDTDARTLYGTMLSWEGRYDEARAELGKVLAASPGHGDAIRSAIHVELWSNHPERALELSTEALQRDPNAADLLVDRVRALLALNRPSAASGDLTRLKLIDPASAEVAGLRRRADAAGRVWTVSGTYTFDVFSTFLPAFQEGVLAAKRSTPIGTVIVRTYEAFRSSDNAGQFELEVFPTIRKGTYADVGAAFSVANAIYPQYRVQLDVYQTLPLGFEASLGYRHLQFGSGVDMGVVTASKYFGNWLLTLRSFVVPDLSGSSISVYASVRRYLSDEVSFVGARYGHGLAKDELYSTVDAAFVGSDTFGGEAATLLFDRLELGARASLSLQGRTAAPGIWQFENTVTVGLRF